MLNEDKPKKQNPKDIVIKPASGVESRFLENLKRLIHSTKVNPQPYMLFVKVTPSAEPSAESSAESDESAEWKKNEPKSNLFLSLI